MDQEDLQVTQERVLSCFTEFEDLRKAFTGYIQPNRCTLCVTDYLSRIITSHSAHACDGQPLRLHCPRHSSISIQSAFYGSSGARLCVADHQPRAHNRSCSAFTALQVQLAVDVGTRM